MRRTSSGRVTFAISSFLLASASVRHAAAEITLVKTDGWQVSTSGRMNAFFSYGWGDGNPIAHTCPAAAVGCVAENIPVGAGLDPGVYGRPGPMLADGTQTQGTFNMMRVRSGFVPNVLSFKIRREITSNVNLEMVATLWATIDTENLRKTNVPFVYMQEGYGRLNAPWGSVTAGRSLDLFSRGATEADFLYGHGYGLGFAGAIDNHGPTNGLIGFGVIAAFFAPGIVYATPSLAGLQLTAGIYDPAPLQGGYEATGAARPEGELTYDLEAGIFKMHLFVNGEYQKVYRTSSTENATSVGAGYGGRFEVSHFHLGVAGHHGKGLGLHYALEASAVSISQDYQLRTFDGYSLMAQYALGPVDLNAGYGISQVALLPSDKADPSVGVPRDEQGYYGAIVFHYSPNYHLDIDYFRGHTEWRFGQKQDVNFLNAGITATW